MSTWTDELREEVKDKYLGSGPTPENTTEIVKEIADELDLSPNGVRMVLSQMGVYIAKSPAAKKTADGEKKPRASSKADAIAELTQVIGQTGIDVDEDIVSKLTGKAATYIASVIKAALDA